MQSFIANSWSPIKARHYRIFGPGRINMIVYYKKNKSRIPVVFLSLRISIRHVFPIVQLVLCLRNKQLYIVILHGAFHWFGLPKTPNGTILVKMLASYSNNPWIVSKHSIFFKVSGMKNIYSNCFYFQAYEYSYTIYWLVI